jgi:two-component system response regulator BaeR
MSKILIVEDELKIASLYQDFLSQSSLDSHIITNGNDVVPWLKVNAVDLIILDLMLPGVDGLSLCREIRSFSTVPIVMVTARVEEIDRIIGLELGADDYVCKPVSPNEVVARVKANLRRSQFNEKVESNIKIDESKFQVWIDGSELELTAIEFQLFTVLAKNPGRVYSREQLMQTIYSDSRVVSDRTIDSHIKKIRRKISHISESSDYIQSLYGVGFRFDPDGGNAQ